jgi:hypothetical protein
VDDLLVRLAALRLQSVTAWAGTASGPALTAALDRCSEECAAQDGGRVTWRIRQITRLLEEVALDLHLESQLYQSLLGGLQWQRLYDAQGQTTWARAA